MPTITPPIQFLSESELASLLETSPPRIARARAAGKIHPDATAARGRERLYDATRLAAIRKAISAN